MRLWPIVQTERFSEESKESPMAETSVGNAPDADSMLGCHLLERDGPPAYHCQCLTFEGTFEVWAASQSQAVRKEADNGGAILSGLCESGTFHSSSTVMRYRDQWSWERAALLASRTQL